MIGPNTKRAFPPSGIVEFYPGTGISERFAVLQTGGPGVDEDGEGEGEQVEDHEQDDTVRGEEGVLNFGKTGGLEGKR